MFAERASVTLTTTAGGAATGYAGGASGALTGRVLAVHYTAGNIGASAAVTITSEATGETILALASVSLTALASYYPRTQTCTSDGTAQLYAAAGTKVTDAVTLANDRIKVVIASGGNATSGTFVFVIG